jgi:hypothetical protein
MISIASLWRDTKTMPYILGVFCQGAMVVTPIIAALLIFPVMEWTINEKALTYSELWSCGAGSVFLLWMLMIATGAWGLAARAIWARWVCVANPVMPLLLAAIHPKTWFTSEVVAGIDIWLSALATSAFIFVCLFFIPSVLSYVHGPKSDADQ